MIKCQSCHAIINREFNYCQNCGSKIITDRLSIKRFFANAFLVLSDFDLPFINTIKWLLVSPKKVTIAYIQGTRKIINSPIQFAVIILSVYGLFQFFFSDFLVMVQKQNGLSGIMDALNSSFQAVDNSNLANATILEDKKSFEKFDKLVNWLQQRNQFFHFLIIPILALVNKITFKNKEYNYAEHLVIASYAVTISILIAIIYGLILAPFKSIEMVAFYSNGTILILICSVFWVVQKTFKDLIYKSAITAIISYLLLMIFAIIAFIISFLIGFVFL